LGSALLFTPNLKPPLLAVINEGAVLDPGVETFRIILLTTIRPVDEAFVVVEDISPPPTLEIDGPFVLLIMTLLGPTGELDALDPDDGDSRLACLLEVAAGADDDVAFDEVDDVEVGFGTS
jgi:hypothetical protein